MTTLRRYVATIVAIGIAGAMTLHAQAKVIELFEDDPAFIDNLTGQDAPTDISIEKKDVFNGKAAIRLEGAANNSQRYNANIAGWGYQIVEDPSGDTEARWIMFAWKKLDGDNGIMIQFPDNGSWGAVNAAFVDPPAPGTRRYIAGENMTGWTGIQLAKDAPADWAVEIRDLFADFKGFTMTGIALTEFAGAGLYDSIYLAPTERDLQKIVDSILAVEPQGKLATTWAGLKR